MSKQSMEQGFQHQMKSEQNELQEQFSTDKTPEYQSQHQPSDSSLGASPKKVGRPAGKETPELIWRRELLEVVRLAKRTREFAASQLTSLEEAAKGADSIKTRLEIARTAMSLLSELTKISSSLIIQIEKRPQDEARQGDFDFEKFLREVK